MPITSHKFGSLDPITGKEIVDVDRPFVTSVCSRKESEMMVAANSSGNMKVLQMVWMNVQLLQLIAKLQQCFLSGFISEINGFLYPPRQEKLLLKVLGLIWWQLISWKVYQAISECFESSCICIYILYGYVFALLLLFLGYVCFARFLSM